MTAHFIDVGQADATLLEFPCGAIMIDAGAESASYEEDLVSYLDVFFSSRPDLNRALAAVYITHNHIDHTRALRRIAERFTVDHFVDGGVTSTSGSRNTRWLRESGRRVREVRDGEVSAVAPEAGLSDPLIDPIGCAQVDPRIQILASRHYADDPAIDPELVASNQNENDQSMVIRVDYGRSSFLLTGDLQISGIEWLLQRYEDSEELLNADVYQVGHHGSTKGTTNDLLDTVTPKISIISVGRWTTLEEDEIADSQNGLAGDNNAGKRRRPFSAFFYGLPRKEIVDLLGEKTQRRRRYPASVMVALHSADFEPLVMQKEVYATGWQGTVKIQADASGRLKTLGLDEEGRPSVAPAELQRTLQKHQRWLESSGAEGTIADLSNRDLSNLDLTGRDLRLARFLGANLRAVTLRNTKLLGTELAGADLRGADMAGAAYAPASAPHAGDIAAAKGLNELIYTDTALGFRDSSKLVELRNSLRDSGFRDQERAVTFALNRISRTDDLEDALRLVAFQWTTAWGLSPGRPLAIIALFILLLWPAYAAAILTGSNENRIWRAVAAKSLEEAIREVEGLPPTVRSAVRWGLYFSIISAFHIGWRELNVGSWIARLQRSEFTLQAKGWPRSLSGLQSLLSVYLLALAVLAYFSRPFG